MEDNRYVSNDETEPPESIVLCVRLLGQTPAFNFVPLSARNNSEGYCLRLMLNMKRIHYIL